ncbi:MAG TPA: FtsX-like permease family protein [Steroidobacteraceae bacterium]|nr:FtsX-like permease family protein [Steroidobacteraceae bacterium]
MKYFHFVWTGLWRKKTRTVFTGLSIVVAFLLYGMLQGIDSTFKQAGDQGRLNVLITMSPTGLPLPFADLSQIEAVHGVTGVTPRGVFVGDYQSMRNLVIVMPVDPDSFFAENSMYSVSAVARAALRRTRIGVLVAQSLVQRLGWKVGEQIPIHALNAQKKDGTADWTFQVVGTFDVPNSPAADEPLLLMNYPYFDTARATDTGTVQFYQETIADASQAATVSNAIDDLFTNSATRTLTETERANAQGQLSQIGDLDFFVEAIVAAAFATLLLLVGSTLMQAYRERVHEFAVMKTLGFTDRGISALVLSEALLLTLGSAVLGLLIAHMMLSALAALMQRAVGITPLLRLHWIVFALGLGFALLLALASALPAAWRAQRLSIVDALAAR